MNVNNLDEVVEALGWMVADLDDIAEYFQGRGDTYTAIDAWRCSELVESLQLRLETML